ncbi:MAG: hypothetical protein PHI97_18965 [Desulfobulbus sp.]|nr:hypothetical protein [Desulfobulbus sp.]
MHLREAYRQKMAAELNLAKAKLAELKAQAENSAADARIKHDEQFDQLEQDVDAIKDKLKELGESSEDSWELIKGGLESSWNILNTTIQRVAAKFKEGKGER